MRQPRRRPEDDAPTAAQLDPEVDVFVDRAAPEEEVGEAAAGAASAPRGFRAALERGELTGEPEVEVIVAVDSVIANLVDQLGINKDVDCYFIPRSHIQLTPVLGNPWTVVDPGATVAQRIRIFR